MPLLCWRPYWASTETKMLAVARQDFGDDSPELLTLLNSDYVTPTTNSKAVLTQPYDD